MQFRQILVYESDGRIAELLRRENKERTVVFLFKPFRLLRFDPPEYELAPDRGVVRWRIRDGLLVARPGEGFLEIEVHDRGPDPAQPGFERLYLEVEVANFYPSLASRLSVPFYKLTQSRIHVLVTYGFLRSLARLDLAESVVGRYVPDATGDVPDPAPPAEHTAA